MAEPFDTLIKVQDHDTTLDQLRHRIEALPERAILRDVGKRRAVIEGELADIQASVDDLAARQRKLEERIAAAATRRHQIEQRMLTGEVTASRDLQAMDTEVHQLSSRQEHFEEEELALLEEEEPLDVVLAESRTALEALAAEAVRLTSAVAEAETDIRATIASEQELRDECASALPIDLAERYETLRARMGGVGAARLVGDRCDGCHLTLPSVEVERIRGLSPGEFATCDQCDRILVH
jgi:predicted  nucleic acid-binding Zn-ribbon protein